MTDANMGARLSENISSYDGLAFGQVGSKGDLSVSRAIATVDGVDQAFDMEIETDAYGNAIFARAYTTYSLASAVPGPSWAATRSNLNQRVLYDPRFHQFVISATNTLGHTTLYEYYGVTEAVNTAGQPFGALKQITDPNGAVTAYSYDAFGRLRKTAAPGDTLGAPSEEIQYFDGVDAAKTDRWPLMVTRIARSVISGTWSLANMATWSRTFYDGLGREIQSMTPAGQGWAQASCNDNPRQTLGNEIIQSSLYDALGRSAVQSVPYTQTQYEYCAPGGPVTTPYVAVPQTAVTQTQPVLSGTGLAAAYYTGKDFNTLALLRTDATVDFDWGYGAPDSRVGADLFSARWTGTVRTNTSESYTFYATGDDGIRLWVNGQLLVDKWQDQGSTEYSAVVPMQAGVPANIVFEYYENGGGAVAKLMWSSPTVSKTVIPATALYVPRSSLTATLTLTPSVPFAKASYDALGRPVQSVGPDGMVQTTMYGSGSTISTDANRHFKFAAKDGLGRLLAVDDAYVNLSDAFDTGNTANFSTTGSATALGGALTLTGTSGLSATLARTGTISDGQGVFIDFWVDQSTVTQSIALARGVTNTSGYRRWGLALEGGKICLDTYDGTTRANSCATGSMLGLKANTWYRAILRLGQGSMNFMAQVWERDNPAVSKEIRLGMPADKWQNQGPWDFVGATYSGVLKLDVYDEFVIYRTRYTNDAADRLTKVVDALGNTTTITYDALGRKVGMVDPDMGTWT